MSTPNEATTGYQRLVGAAQAQGRVPALQVAIHRHDRPLWTAQIGTSGTERPLDAGTQFRIGSITKTFTAVLVMQARDEGLLDLDDPIGKHLPVPRHGEATIRRLLSHTAGIAREPFGDVWDSLDSPDLPRLLAELAQAERVLPPGRRFHYSNLGVALLGQAVAGLRGGSYGEVLADRVLRPLQLDGVALGTPMAAAQGYLVDAYSDHAQPEPAVDIGAIAPAGQLWGTATDLARWAAFLADPATVDPDARVLSAQTLEEMRWPVTVTDDALWAAGFGLGLLLVPQSNRIMHVGHDGAMPGFLAAAYGRRGGTDCPPGLSVAALGSSGTATEIIELPHTLLTEVVRLDPAERQPWRPGRPAPAHLAGVLGHWWGEGVPYVFSWHDDALQARRVDDPDGRPPAVFAEVQPDLLRTVSGREVGEMLRLTRAQPGGEVVRLNWATYRFTREQESFERVRPARPTPPSAEPANPA